MINNDNPETGSAMPKNEQCVPLAALAVDGTPPAQGDEVDYTVKGKISRIEGDKAYVSPSAVNGEPLPADEKPAAEEDPMEAALKADEESTSKGY